jgi:hypothetical protein
MKSFLRFFILVAFTSVGTAYADDDCRRAMSEWQPREVVTSFVKQLGLESERLRIDDGCYEVRARDAQGNRVKLKIDPATLDILKLEVGFKSGNDTSRYMPGSGRQKGKAANRSEGQSPDSPTPSSPGGVR